MKRGASTATSRESIEVGDLVMLVRQHCTNKASGEIAKVTHFERCALRCSHCGTPLGSDEVVFTDGRIRAPRAWLKRIPPLSELEGERTQEDIREPA